MAKHIFIFALVVLACAHQSQARLVDPNLASNVKNAAIQQISALGAEIYADVLKARDLVDQTMTNAKGLVTSSLSHFKTQFEDAIARAMKVYNNQKEFIKSECNSTIIAFTHSYETLVSETDACVDNHLQSAMAHMNEIVHTADVVRVRLSEITEEASHCTDKAHGIIDFAAASICTAEAIIKATAAVARQVPHVTMEMTKLSTYTGTLPAKVAYCTSIKSMGVFFNDFTYNLDKLYKCIA